MGIRYLDMRISYRSNTPEKWWINHGLVSLRPFIHVVQHLKTFLSHTNEIVVLDFHELTPGITYFTNCFGYLQTDSIIHKRIQETTNKWYNI